MGECHDFEFIRDGQKRGTQVTSLPISNPETEEGSLFSDFQAGLKEALEHEEGKETSIQIHQVQDFRFRATTDNKATTEITELPKNE